MASSLMLLSNPFRPDPRVLREARGLVEEGYGVTVIAWDRDGGRRSSSAEEGVRVIRLGPRAPYRSVSRVGPRLVRFWSRAFREARDVDFDIVHCHDFDTLPLGLVLARLRRVPLVYDAHEIYSNMISKDAPFIARVMWPVEKWFSLRADEVLTVNELMAETLSAGREEPARLVRNSPDMSVLREADVQEIRERHGLTGFVISYLGSLEPGRSVVELARSFSDDEGVTVAIGGSGTLESAVSRACEENPRAVFLGKTDPDESLRITFASNLVPAMHDPSNPNYRIGTPIKVLEAMACGRPVLTAEGLDISETVRSVGCGIVIDYDEEEIVRAVAEAKRSRDGLTEMGSRGKKYYDRNLSWEASKGELLAAYRAQLGPYDDDSGG